MTDAIRTKGCQTLSFTNLLEHKRFDSEKYQKVLLLESPQSALDIYCLMPGQGQKLHAHQGTDKYYLIWEGRATVQIGDEIRELGPGDAALAKADVPHAITNNSGEPVVAVVFRTLLPK
jgi:mannose-6-phosphate isomerase-like protein (cupin superfamily)